MLALKEQEYIQAAKAIGGTHFKIIMKHILPNVASSILVLATMCIAEFILLEASLTFFRARRGAYSTFVGRNVSG
ncbi:ABC transporter permease subunit [Lysinibacillus sp. MHQ-1]|nr:ABC transporter permease subunit [Lysinibacillus sp. MHQ-1]